MATVYTKQARKNDKGVIFAPGKDEKTGRYFVFRLCENHDGKVRGDIRKTWRVVSPWTRKPKTLEESKAEFRAIQNGLTLDEAKKLFEKKVGKSLYA
jgi:hypothetical protein